MPAHPIRSIFHAVALGLLAVTVLPGCSTWRPMAGSPDATLIPPRERSVRVELQDGTRFELLHPKVVEDTVLVGRRLIGRFEPDAATLGPEEPRRIATSQLIGIDTRQRHEARTLIVGTIVGVGILLALDAIVDSFEKSMGEGVATTVGEMFPSRPPPPPPARH